MERKEAKRLKKLKKKEKKKRRSNSSSSFSDSDDSSSNKKSQRRSESKNDERSRRKNERDSSSPERRDHHRARNYRPSIPSPSHAKHGGDRRDYEKKDKYIKSEKNDESFEDTRRKYNQEENPPKKRVF
ncbi:unnamed protein product [Lepeophtheirus salmonis]|uniref:(salmon louse) hypothetical protein n=1 Tax=Lepeophtheirus salmonis TaxID=72036 RepID=A0A7R8H1N6_LEPSM|nr:unnamed protein product [Lepeophtheirus salmonis]CAF2812825.1 unnamed protein product [Lepeophtheirus salmonis]